MNYIVVVSNKTTRRVVMLDAEDRNDILKKCYSKFGAVTLDKIIQLSVFPASPLEITASPLPENEREVRAEREYYELYRQPTIRLHSKSIVDGNYADVDHEEVLALIGIAATGERVDYKEPTRDWLYALVPWTSQEEIRAIMRRLVDAGYEVHGA